VAAKDDRASVHIEAADRATDVVVDRVVSRGTSQAVEVCAGNLERTQVTNVDHDTEVGGGGLRFAGHHISWVVIGAVGAIIMIPAVILIAILS
jgi:hypothetical protein